MPKNVSQGKDTKKCLRDTNFQAPMSTGRKVEMACANADNSDRQHKPCMNMALVYVICIAVHFDLRFY